MRLAQGGDGADGGKAPDEGQRVAVGGRDVGGTRGGHDVLRHAGIPAGGVFQVGNGAQNRGRCHPVPVSDELKMQSQALQLGMWADSTLCKKHTQNQAASSVVAWDVG